MKNFFVLLLVAIPGFMFGQSAKYTEVQNKTIAIGTRGFAEYLPANYNSGVFPVVIYLHGVGDRGNGTSELYKIGNYGPAYHLKWGGWRPNIIMIAPQWLAPSTWPSPEVIDQVIDYVVANYRVDISRIYLTGLSMGGGATWDYAASSATRANRLAAILPVCGYSGAWQQASVIGKSNLPVLATHNNGDPTVPYSMSVNWVNNVNVEKPNPAALLLTYNNNSHNAWDSTYNPSLFLLNGNKNWLDWMLQYSRNGGTTTPTPTQPPTTPPSSGDSSIFISPVDERYITVTRGWAQTVQDIYGEPRFISGTTQQSLYSVERWGNFSYKIPVKNGSYSVKFYFAELYFNSVGQRVFNVDAEGTRIVSNLDMLAIVPKFTAIERTYTVNVTDGYMDINFVPTIGVAKMSGIEIKPLGSTSTSYNTTVEIRDSATNSLLKTYSDVFTAPVKVVIKN